MTGREIIAAVCVTTRNLDLQLPIKILHRDRNHYVVGQQQISNYRIINGKLLIEADSISSRVDDA